MKYLLLAYKDTRWWDALSASERFAFEEERRANDETLRQSGHLLAAATLHSHRAITTVRVQEGEACVADGPHAEALEQPGGIFFIHARDLNEAIQVAAKMPQAHSGPIEVWPINE
jgi:hypothetical protein